MFLVVDPKYKTRLWSFPYQALDWIGVRRVLRRFFVGWLVGWLQMMMMNSFVAVLVVGVMITMLVCASGGIELCNYS